MDEKLPNNFAVTEGVGATRKRRCWRGTTLPPLRHSPQTRRQPSEQPVSASRDNDVLSCSVRKSHDNHLYSCVLKVHDNKLYMRNWALRSTACHPEASSKRRRPRTLPTGLARQNSWSRIHNSDARARLCGTRWGEDL